MLPEYHRAAESASRNAGTSWRADPAARQVRSRILLRADAHGPGAARCLRCDGPVGRQWLEIEPRHLDAAYVLWATSKLADPDRIPVGTTVVRFDLTDSPKDRYWIVLRQPQAELCTRPNGMVEDVICTTTASCLVDLHLRRTTCGSARRDGRLALNGPPGLTRNFSKWFRSSPFAQFDGARRS